jgi:ubiquinone/menaquinone biosynthesis C-methylase UbiE
MVAEAEAALAKRGHHFEFQQANIQTLDFADETFDVVVANHMLYHVPDLPQALAEVRRVLKPNGRFIAATNGNDHMKELPLLIPDEVQEMAASLRIRGEAEQLSFRLENGRSLLEPFFHTVAQHLYADSLYITEVDPLLAYAFSMLKPETYVPETAVDHLREIWAAKIEAEGGMHISKHSGVFVASNLAK